MPALPNNSSTRKYEVKTIQDRQRAIARHISMGLKNKEIAALLGVTEQCVSINRNSRLVRELIDELHGEADEEAVKAIPEQIAEMCQIAVDNVKAILNNPQLLKEDPKLVATVSRDIIDRAGYSPVRRIAGEIEHDHFFSAEDIRSIKDRYRELQTSTIEVNAEIEVHNGSEHKASRAS